MGRVKASKNYSSREGLNWGDVTFGNKEGWLGFQDARILTHMC